MSDDACVLLRHLIIEQFGFDPGKENSREAAHTLSIENPFHTVREYLAKLRWDGVRRIDDWLCRHLGAEVTNFTKTIGAIVLVAAVRRIRAPGTKLDNTLVLKGPQGAGKSTAIKILAGEEYFSDQGVLTLDSKAQMEALEGVWLFEICELEGMSRADTGIRRAQLRDGSLSEFTKTAAGAGDIPMSPRLREMLLAWRVRCPRNDGRLERVFPAPGVVRAWPLPREGGGGPLIYNNYRTRFWAPFVRKLELNPIRMHHILRRRTCFGIRWAGRGR